MSDKRRYRKLNKKGAKLVAVIFLLSAIVVGEAQIWGPDTRLTNSIGTSVPQSRSLAVSADTIHVVWEDNRGGGYEIYYKHSADNAETWSDDTLLGGIDARQPSVAVSGSNVHVVWVDRSDDEIYYKRSTDNGNSWDGTEALTADDSVSTDPALAVSGTNTHVIWSDERDGNPEIYYKRSTNSGSNWDLDRRGTTNDSLSVTPAIAVSGDTLHVVFTDERDGNPEIYYKRSVDNGDNWGTDVRLTNDVADSYWPAVAASASAVHVAWQDSRDGDYKLFYKRSTDNGVTWEADTAFSPGVTVPPYPLTPSLACWGDNVYLVWEDYFDGNPEIYCKRSQDAGATWDETIRLTDDPATSRQPSVAVWDYNVYVLWADDRAADMELYFKHGLSGELQPDNLIKNDIETFYIGDGIYNDDGTNQVEERTVGTAQTAVFDIRIENDGEIPEDIIVNGTAGETGWMVSYYDSLTGGTDITVLMTTLFWPTSVLQPGEFVEIRAEVTPDATVPQDSSFGILVASVSEYDSTRLDAVRAVTTVGQTGMTDESVVPLLPALTVNSSLEQPVMGYSVPQATEINLFISDVSGRKIRILVSQEQSAGNHRVVWDARDDSGFLVGAGVYFCTMKTGQGTLCRKFILLE